MNWEKSGGAWALWHVHATVNDTVFFNFAPQGELLPSVTEVGPEKGCG